MPFLNNPQLLKHSKTSLKLAKGANEDMKYSGNLRTHWVWQGGTIVGDVWIKGRGIANPAIVKITKGHARVIIRISGLQAYR
jgi:hypothetical protein